MSSKHKTKNTEIRTQKDTHTHFFATKMNSKQTQGQGANKTHSQNEVRNMAKKGRTKERKAMEFPEGSEKRAQYLRERDECNDRVAEMKRNIAVNAKNKEKKEKKMLADATKSDEQWMNEAQAWNRKQRNAADKKKMDEQIKNDELNGKRAAALALREEKKKKEEEKDEAIHNMIEDREAQKKEMKETFAKEYKEKHPNASDSEIQKEFVKKIKHDNREENIAAIYVENMSGITEEEPAKVYEDYKEMHKEFMKRSDIALKMNAFHSSKREEVLNLLEEEVKAQIIENGCRKQFCESVKQMTGESEEVIQKEYDEDYEKFKVYADEQGYTRAVAVDKYVDLSNKKLQVAQFRYTIVNRMMEDKNMSVDEANEEFDKMMNAMNQSESNEPMCLPCK